MIDWLMQDVTQPRWLYWGTVFLLGWWVVQDFRVLYERFRK